MDFVLNKIDKLVDNHRSLDQNMKDLKRKLEDLNALKEDTESKVRAELQPRKKPRKQFHLWLANIERINGEIQDLEQKVAKSNTLACGFYNTTVLEKKQEVEDLLQQGKFDPGAVVDDLTWIGQALSTTNLVGKAAENCMEEIWTCLMDDYIGKIGVWGMGGLGKTTIMKLINNKLLEETQKFNIVIWITVSKEMNITKIQNGISQTMKVTLPENADVTRAGMLHEMLTRRGKYVLILDDLWDKLSLEQVGIPEPSNGSKLVVTTRMLDVCRYLGCREIRMSTLPKQDAWSLFSEKVGRDVLNCPDLLSIVESVAEECAGLPLAIVTVASGMKGITNVHEWRNAVKELSRCVSGVTELDEKVFQQLQFSYDHLKNERVQHCFLCCALYPEDYSIPERTLIELWIAEGLVEEMDSQQAEFDQGYTILNKLKNNCLLENDVRQVWLLKEGESTNHVKLHDLVRDMALRITSVKPRFLIRAGQQLKEIPRVQEWTKDLEKVSLMFNFPLQIPSQMSPPKCQMLTTLLLSDCGIKSIPDCFFEQMKGLKVLDLSGNNFRILPSSISNLEALTVLLVRRCHYLEKVPSFSKLEALKKLDLSYSETHLEKFDFSNSGTHLVSQFSCNNSLEIPSQMLAPMLTMLLLTNCQIKSIPDCFFEQMKGLKVLDLSGISFRSLPSSISNLEALTELLVRGCDYLKRVPSFSKLEALKKLDLSGRRINYLPRGIFPKFSCLRDLVIFDDNNLQLCVKGEEVGELRKLQYFKGRFDDLNELNSFAQTSQSRGQRLIRYHMAVGGVAVGCDIPCDSKWDKKIELFDCNFCRNGLKLPSDHQHLTIVGNANDIDIPEEEVFFPWLIPTPNGMFSFLKEINIYGCEKIKKLFTCSWVQSNLPNLEVLTVLGCYDMEEIIASEMEFVEEERMGGTNSNTIQFTLPKLRILVLVLLPDLKSICGANRVLVCDSIEEIVIDRCSKLQRIPLYLPLLDDGQPSPPPFLEKIYISSEKKLSSVEWDHPNAKSVLEPFLKTNLLDTYGLDPESDEDPLPVSDADSDTESRYGQIRSESHYDSVPESDANSRS